MKIDVIKNKSNQEIEFFKVIVSDGDDIDVSPFNVIDVVDNSYIIHISDLKDFWYKYSSCILPTPEILTHAVLSGVIDANFSNERAIVLGGENLKALEITADRMKLSEQYGLLMHHQKVGALKILQRDGILIADMMGLGKTLTALFGLVVDPSIKKTLIVCPSTMKFVWQKEIQQWFPGKKISVINGNAQQRFQQYSSPADFIIVSFDLIRRPEDIAMIEFLSNNGSYEYTTIDCGKNKYCSIPIYPHQEKDNSFEYLLSWDVKISRKEKDIKTLLLEYSGEPLFKVANNALVFDALIVDEAHHIKSASSQQTKAINSIAKNINKKVLLTGTPIMNKVEEIWSLLNLIQPYKFPNFWAFRNQYCIMKQIQTKTGKKINLIVGYKNLDNLQKKMSEVMLRRNKMDTLKDLPAKTYEVREVELSKEQKKLYKEFKEEISVWIEESGKEIKVQQALDKMMRLKQVAISPELFGGTDKSSKLDELENIVEEIVSNGSKVIIFSQFKKATYIILKRLEKMGYKNKQVAYISGDVEMQVSSKAKEKGKTDRMEEIKRFQEDPDCKIFVGVIDACKEGITLTAANYVVFVDKKWTPADNQQAEDRAHRKGQINPVTIISLIASDTIEEYIEEKLKDKTALFDQLIGGTLNHQNTLREVKKLLKDKKTK